MSIIDRTWILNRARSFLGQNVTGQVDFKDEDILACLDLKAKVAAIYKE